MNTYINYIHIQGVLGELLHTLRFIGLRHALFHKFPKGPSYSLSPHFVFLLNTLYFKLYLIQLLIFCPRLCERSKPKNKYVVRVEIVTLYWMFYSIDNITIQYSYNSNISKGFKQINVLVIPELKKLDFHQMSDCVCLYHISTVDEKTSKTL